MYDDQVKAASDSLSGATSKPNQEMLFEVNTFKLSVENSYNQLFAGYDVVACPCSWSHVRKALVLWSFCHSANKHSELCKNTDNKVTTIAPKISRQICEVLKIIS